MDFAFIAREYPALRSAGVPLANSLAKRLESADIDQAARDLGILHGKTIRFETEGEIAVLLDYAIHDIRRDGLNVIDRILRDRPPAEGSIQLRLLRSMQRARFSIFTVTDLRPGIGVHGVEGPERNPCFIADVGFSTSTIPGVSIAARLHSPYDGWHITTGAALPVPQGAVDGIVRDIEAYFRRHGVVPAAGDASALVLRNCLATGASRSIRYAATDLGASPINAERAPRSNRVGRNDPCPCGSGKKYKKCCWG